jgi:hypothetical protein
VNPLFGMYHLINNFSLVKMLVNLGFKKIITTYKDNELVYYTKTLKGSLEWNTIIDEL